MRRLVAVLCVALVACAGEVGTTTLPTVAPTAAPTVTTTTTTTTTVPGTTTTTMPVTTTTKASEVPAELLALIGAPMPEVDLTIEGPEDVERWIAEFLRWENWLVANPEVEIGDVGLVGEYGASLQEGRERATERGLRVLSGGLDIGLAEVRFGDAGLGYVRLVVDATRRRPSYLVEWDGKLVSVSEPDGTPLIADVLLELDAGGRWGISQWSVRS